MKVSATKALLRVFSAIILMTWTCPSFADDGRPSVASDRFSAGVVPSYQFRSDINGGGDLSVFRLFLRADWDRRSGGPLDYGLGMNYAHYNYSFSGMTDFGGKKPWDTVNNFGIGGRIAYGIDPKWRVFINPSIEYAGAPGAPFDSSLIWGAVLGTTHKVNSNLTIGAGVGLFSRMHEFSVFPMLLVNWRITENLRLTNPMRGGATGPAGLELSYALPDGWKIGTGAAYRSYRFRLEDKGFAPKGIASDRVVPVWARISKRVSPDFSIDLTAGAMLAGEIKVEGENGTGTATRNYNAAPFASLSLTGRF